MMGTPPIARAATPITACGTTITTPGSYVVTKNLTVKKTTGETVCIGVDTNDVTIDLSGFTIDCAGNESAIAIESVAGGLEGFIVRNGHVTGSCASAVDFFETPGVLVERVSVVADFDDGIELGIGSLGIDNVVTDTSDGPGIFGDCPAAIIDNTLLSNVSGNLSFGGDGCVFFNNLAP